MFYNMLVDDVIMLCTRSRHLNTPAIHVVRIRVRGTSDRSPSFLVQTSDFSENFCSFTKSDYCVSFQMKHNLEMFCGVREITYNSDMVKMHKIT